MPVASRVRDLLGRMTPEEKFWQLFMLPGSLDDPSSVTPTAIVWTDEAPAWAHLNDALDQYPGQMPAPVVK